MASKQEAFPWIRRIHDIGMGGAAVVSWSPIAIRRAQEAGGIHHSTLHVLDFASRSSKISSPEKEMLRKFPVTNLERLLDNPDVLALLGIQLRDGRLVCQYAERWTEEVLTKIVGDIAAKRIKVKDIFDKPLQVGYVNNVIAHVGAATKSSGGDWPLDKGGLMPLPPTPTELRPGPRIRPVATDRRYLIPSSCKLLIPHPRLNEIYHELRRRLPVDSVPNSVGVLFRVFVEFSAEEFAKRHSISFPGPPKDSLVTKLMIVANHMEQSGMLTKNELKGIRVALSNPHDLMASNTLNAYVHNPDFAPSPVELKRSWDRVEKFVETLWK